MCSADVSSQGPAVISKEKVDVTHSSEVAKINKVHLLITIWCMGKKGRHCWGPTEDEISKACGLDKDQFSNALYLLLESDKSIVHHFSQEGTAGPFAHRYEVARDLSVHLEWTPMKKG